MGGETGGVLPDQSIISPVSGLSCALPSNLTNNVSYPDIKKPVQLPANSGLAYSDIKLLIISQNILLYLYCFFYLFGNPFYDWDRHRIAYLLIQLRISYFR